MRLLPDKSLGRHRALVYETVFALLYGLGLRAGEAARLKLGDVDFAQDTLFIYSDSPIWREYMINEVLPLVHERAIVLNWSQRRT